MQLAPGSFLLRAAFAIAPVLGPVMTKASLAEIKVPVRIIVGSKDDQAFPDVNARPMASAIPNAELEIIPDVAHYTFLARCNLLGKVVARSLCTDPDGIDRGEVHRRVSADALEFFSRTLRGEPAALNLTIPPALVLRANQIAE